MPTKNFFSMPNAITDIVANITNLAEVKVIIYVIRHTWGFHEYGKPKAISVDEFMHGRKYANGTRMDKGTGLSNRSVIDGLRAAVNDGYLTCDIDNSDLARVKKSYSLKMACEDATPGEEPSPHEDATPGEESKAGCEESSPSYEERSHLSEESSHRSEKNTSRNKPKKDTEEKQGVRSDGEECSNAPSGTDVPTPARVSHPEHDFIWFDDLVKPTVMWVRYTQAFPGPMFSEYEDKRRSRKSDEVRCFLEGRGINVKLICEHETGDERTIESTPYQPDSYSLNHTEDAFHGTAGSSNHLRWDRTGDLVGTGEHPQSATRDTGCDVRLQPTGTDQTTSAGRAECGAGDARTGTTGDGVAPVHASESGYEKQERPVQATLTGATQQESARRAPVDVTTLTIKAHVNYVFKWLDAVRQKAEENPQASYVQNGTAEKLVRDLINATMNTPNELTERNVHIAWMAMWKSPAGRDGFTWGEPGKISIAAFCRNYGEYLARGRDSLAKRERKSTSSSSPVVGVSGRRNLNIPAPVAR